MGLIFLDYFLKSDPFEINFRLLVLGGFWPLDTKKKWLQVLCSIYSYLCCFSIISMLFIQVLDVYLLRNDPLNLARNLCASSVTFACVVKYLLMFYKIDDMLELHETLEKFRKSKSNPKDVEIMKNAQKEIDLSTKTFYSLAVPCIAAWMLYPWLESGNEKRVPFPYRLPVDDWSTPIYEILYVYQSLSMVGYMINLVSNDLVFYGFIVRMNAQYDIVLREIKDLDEILSTVTGNDTEDGRSKTTGKYDSATSEKIFESIKSSVELHQKVLQEINKLKDIYSQPALIHFFSITILVGVIVIDVIVISKGFRLQMIQRMMYTICGLFDTFMYCLFATKLQDKSLKIVRAVYSTPWYKMNPKLRKELLVIMMRANHTPLIRVGNFFPLNLSTFLVLLKTCYNISALLYQTIRK